MYRNPDLGELSGNHISVHVPPRKGGPVVEEMFGMRSQQLVASKLTGKKRRPLETARLRGMFDMLEMAMLLWKSMLCKLLGTPCRCCFMPGTEQSKRPVPGQWYQEQVHNSIYVHTHSLHFCRSTISQIRARFLLMHLGWMKNHKLFLDIYTI